MTRDVKGWMWTDEWRTGKWGWVANVTGAALTVAVPALLPEGLAATSDRNESLLASTLLSLLSAVG